MKKMKVLNLVLIFTLLAVSLLLAGGQKETPEGEVKDPLYAAVLEEGGEVVSYDTGPHWANWSEEFKEFEAAYPGVKIAYNDLGSGATVARLEKESLNTQADTAYYSFTYGDIAKQKGLTQGYKPPNFEKIPEGLRDPEGHWFTIHMGTVAFAVNTKIIKNVPQSWSDLLKPEYKNTVVYLDPRTTGVGFAVLVASAVANGGSETNLDPGIAYLAKLQKAGNVKSIDTTVAKAKFLKGEIPIWISYDFNQYKAKYLEGAECEIVIPKDGSVTVPYVISMVNKAPHPNAAKLWLNWILSEKGQKIFARGFVRPVVPGIELPESVKKQFLPDSAYAAAKNIDWSATKTVLEDAKKKWEKEVLGQ